MAEQDTPIVMKGEKMDTDEVSLAPTEICIRLMVELPLRQVGYDYGQDMKTTIDRTARENLKPQLYEVGQVVRMQINEGTKKRPVMNYRRFVIRHAKRDRTTGKWKYQLDYENDGVSVGPYEDKEYFRELSLKNPLTGLSH